MELTEADITEFQNIFRQATGLEIDRETARENAERLLRFVELLGRIGPS